jgi:hypothetical protein
MVKHICSYHHISEGSVELACDGLSALNKAFSQVSILQLEDPNYDLIAAIKHQWLYSPLLWKIRHVKGHQDDHTAIQQLDRWGQLNVEMDLLAKAYIPFAKSQPRHFTILGEPWSIWVGGKKIVKDITETLYEIAHVESVKQYWISKDRVTADSFSEINWDTMKKAMLQSPRSRRTFASKHTVGMCGVGKFMQRWKEWESPNCPRCGQFEDAAHVWVCSGSNAGEIWEKSLCDLNEWMSSVNTDPDIQSAILHFLQSWRNNTTPTITLDSDIAQLIQKQDTLGWQQFFEGWIPVCWEEAQQLYYSLIQSHCTGRRWIISLIKKLWNVAWDLWEHRNGILHNKENITTTTELRLLRQRVQTLFHLLQHLPFPAVDSYLMSQPLEILLNKDTPYLKTRLTQAEAVVAVGRKSEWANRHTTMLRNMSQVMYRWLRRDG